METVSTIARVGLSRVLPWSDISGIRSNTLVDICATLVNVDPSVDFVLHALCALRLLRPRDTWCMKALIDTFAENVADH